MSCKERCKNGFCLNSGHGNLVCTCNEGWKGANCDIPINNCQDTCVYGFCLGDDGNSDCYCYKGYKGKNCDIPINNCQDTCVYGFCLGDDGNSDCYCYKGYKGKNCDIPITCENTCQYGKCVDNKCVCDSGWQGENCDTTIITCAQTCKNGKCVNDKCVCDSKWKGENCDTLRECLDSKCKHGKCINDKCVCDSGGWSGPNCDACPQDYLLVKDTCIAPGHGWVKEKGDIPYMNTCILPGECPFNTTHMGRCDGTTEEDTSYCLPNEIWCDDESCWGPTNTFSDSWINSASKGSLISCANAYTGQNIGYPDRSNKNPNPDAWKYPRDGIGCRQGIGWCGVSNSNRVGLNDYKDPPGGPQYNKISNLLWPDTFQRRCVLK